ncbi:Replication protein C N-terminal domain-containing protein [Ensifer adhaerens]|nr:Replication protein C N-terminal domain-containing protein [Ensifer adhaerens]
MQLDHVTTPFGRRPLTYAMLKDQMASAEIEDGARADKWKLYRALCEARERLGVTDRALAILNALLSFYPKNELAAEDTMIVFPSNAQLSLRAHGMAEQTIRRHLASLIEAGLLNRRDSANGKRFVRRDREGQIDEAFGFSLAPLLARADEIERLAAEVEAERLTLQRLKERLTICRRDVMKLIETAIEEGASGDWDAAQAEYRAILADYPRKPSAAMVAETLDAMTFLRENIVNQLEMQLKTQNQSGNAYQDERHIQNSNPDSISELEPRFEKTQGQNRDEDRSGWAKVTGVAEGGERGGAGGRQTGGTLGADPDEGAAAENARQSRQAARIASAENANGAKSAAGEGGSAQLLGSAAADIGSGQAFRAAPLAGQTAEGAPERKSLDRIAGLKPFPLGMVLLACPEIADYGPGGHVTSWRDLMSAAVVVRSMLGVSPSAYEEACGILGPENAATVIACILERAGHINSAGGYLRDLTRRAERGEFSLGPMLMAQMRGQVGQKARAG